jgi:hypothetical protein
MSITILVGVDSVDLSIQSSRSQEFKYVDFENLTA